MCGIVAYFSKGDRPKSSTLESATLKLAHRGPDESNTWYSGDRKVGLGHRRLSILDLTASGQQPMQSYCGRYQIVFNGEIYNFQSIAMELFDTLNLKEVIKSDTRVLIEAFKLWGYNFIRKIKGMFAFVIYDKLENEFWVFRDRMGIKPLYYCRTADLFVCASELKAILPFLKDKPIPNKKAITQFLHLGYIPAPNSIFEEIHKFPKGHYLQLKVDFSGDILPFWNLSDLIEKQPIFDEQSAFKTLKTKLESAVKSQMVSDVPVGSFLSGGIDSSLVTALASKQSEKQFSTFSIGFESSKFNESKYAAAVAQYLGTDHTSMVLSEQSAKDLVLKMEDLYDEPFADTSCIPTYLVSQLAKKSVKVILTGDGGDEQFLGYGMYTWAARLQNPLLYSSRKVLSSLMGTFGNSKLKRVGSLLNMPANAHRSAHIFSQEQYMFTSTEIESLLNESCHSDFELVLPNNRVFNRKMSASEAQAIFDLEYYLPDDLLVKVDRASMAHGLECRVPLLDEDVVAFVLNLSENLKLKGGVSKYLLKEVLFSEVPKKYFDRPKWGFGVPLHSWLEGDLAFLVNDYLSESALVETGLFQPSAVNLLLRKWKNGDSYLYNRVWLLIVLQKWWLNNVN